MNFRIDPEYVDKWLPAADYLKYLQEVKGFRTRDDSLHFVEEKLLGKSSEEPVKDKIFIKEAMHSHPLSSLPKGGTEYFFEILDKRQKADCSDKEVIERKAVQERLAIADELFELSQLLDLVKFLYGEKKNELRVKLDVPEFADNTREQLEEFGVKFHEESFKRQKGAVPEMLLSDNESAIKHPMIVLPKDLLERTEAEESELKGIKTRVTAHFYMPIKQRFLSQKARSNLILDDPDDYSSHKETVHLYGEDIKKYKFYPKKQESEVSEFQDKEIYTLVHISAGYDLSYEEYDRSGKDIIFHDAAMGLLDQVIAKMVTGVNFKTEYGEPYLTGKDGKSNLWLVWIDYCQTYKARTVTCLICDSVFQLEGRRRVKVCSEACKTMRKRYRRYKNRVKEEASKPEGIRRTPKEISIEVEIGMETVKALETKEKVLNEDI